jgi:hypothetical protein
LFIRPDLKGKRKLSFYFTFVISRKHYDGQNPSLVTTAHQTLDKTGYPKKLTNKGELYFVVCDQRVFIKTIIQMIPAL